MKKCYAKNTDKHKAVKCEYSKTSDLLNPKRKKNIIITPTLNQRRHPLERAIGMTLS